MITIKTAERKQIESVWPSAAELAADAVFMTAQDGQVFLGGVAAILCGETVEVVGLFSQDAVMGEGLLRAMLAQAQQQGARTATISTAVCEDLPLRLGMQRQGDGWIGELAAVFSRRCCG